MLAGKQLDKKVAARHLEDMAQDPLAPRAEELRALAGALDSTDTELWTPGPIST